MNASAAFKCFEILTYLGQSFGVWLEVQDDEVCIKLTLMVTDCGRQTWKASFTAEQMLESMEDQGVEPDVGDLLQAVRGIFNRKQVELVIDSDGLIPFAHLKATWVMKAGQVDELPVKLRFPPTGDMEADPDECQHTCFSLLMAVRDYLTASEENSAQAKKAYDELSLKAGSLERENEIMRGELAYYRDKENPAGDQRVKKKRAANGAAARNPATTAPTLTQPVSPAFTAPLSQPLADTPPSIPSQRWADTAEDDTGRAAGGVSPLAAPPIFATETEEAGTQAVDSAQQEATTAGCDTSAAPTGSRHPVRGGRGGRRGAGRMAGKLTKAPGGLKFSNR